MNSFEYASPNTLEEATSLLGSHWGETEVLAGGTDLVTSLKQDITRPQRVISLKNIKSLQGIAASEKSVRIGATTSLRVLADHAAIREHFPSLVTATENIGSAQTIAVGTVAGDLCQRPRCWYFRNGYGLLGTNHGKSLIPGGENRYHAIFGNDGPAYFVTPSSLGPTLIALGATINVAGKDGGTRAVSASQFFRIPKAESERETVLKPSEIVTSIDIPINGLNNAIYEVRHRHGFDWPYVAAAIAFESSDGKTSNARVVLGHVAPKPWICSAAENLLNSSIVTESLAEQVGHAATQGAKPLSGNGYKIQLVKTAVKRAILIAAGISRKG